MEVVILRRVGSISLPDTFGKKGIRATPDESCCSEYCYRESTPLSTFHGAQTGLTPLVK